MDKENLAYIDRISLNYEKKKWSKMNSEKDNILSEIGQTQKEKMSYILLYM